MSNQNIDNGWRQVNLWCQDWQSAEQMAITDLQPLLTRIETEGSDSSICWWFVRKGPSWRLRLRCADGHGDTATATLRRVATTLMDRGAIRQWTEVIYEPEVHAFGGVEAMAVAYELFSADSRHLLTHLAQARTDHRRELGLLLGTRLLHAAGQDWYEQGDIWEQLAGHRSSDEHSLGRPAPTTVAAVRRLLTAAADTDDSPLRSTPAWPMAFQHAGEALADLAQQGVLTRGPRAVLTHHLLFSFNRLGVSAEHQHLLATTASKVIFQHEHAPPQSSAAGSGRARPATVRAVTTDTTTTDPAQLRAALADYIRGRKTFRTARVEDAFRTVPRHVFLPGVDLETAYAPRPVVTKRADDGTSVSSASSPNLVAEMLELLDVQPGHRILEIGAATGINAALLAELTGPTGRVVTIELDDDLAAGARSGLAAAGYDQVQVICGDGALGYPGCAPYDRIIVTAGAWDIAAAWWQQLTVGGRLVVPLRLHGSGLTRVLSFDLDRPDRMVSTTAQVCGFVPMRGAGEQAEHHVRLDDDIVLKVDTVDRPDTDALTNALTHPAREHWTGIQIHDEQPAEHLDLWLNTTDKACNFGRLSVGSAAGAGCLVDPALRWAGATLYEGGTIAYLAVKPHSDDINELGIIAHGPNSNTLAAQADDLLQRWDRQRPNQPIITASPTGQLDTQAPSAAHIDRPHTRLTIAW